MKNLIALFASAVLLLSVSITSSAGVITDTVAQNQYVGWFDSYSYTHDITDDGFVLGDAIEGSLTINLYDDGGRFDLIEIALVIVDGFDFDTGGLTFGSSFSNDLEVNALLSLNADGMLDVTIASVFGDFYAGDSILEVVTTSVPEPATAFLLGLSLVGFGASRIRRSN
jgi:hypothetical protein